ncbi:hypothetical protein BDZ45DRAFT_723716 [Acephala macrosclerotiorum]|nr:hypothetical protein BDZ45DRAFT_723716 [Acephala macrosclerotiorum]
MPGGIIESIMGSGEKAIEQIPRPPNNYIASFLKKCRQAYQCRASEDGDIHHRCDNLIYGSVVNKLNDDSLWQTSPCDVGMQLSSAVDTVRLLHQVTSTLNGDYELYGIPSFQVEVEAILAGLDPVLDCHRRHMELRAAQLAFSNDSDIKNPGAKRRKILRS